MPDRAAKHQSGSSSQFLLPGVSKERQLTGTVQASPRRAQPEEQDGGSWVEQTDHCVLEIIS